jgi:hypothetical protein
MLKIKQNAERLQEDAVKSEHDDDEARPSKRTKTEDASGLTPEGKREISIFLKYKSMNNDQLKDILRYVARLNCILNFILLQVLNIFRIRIMDIELKHMFLFFHTSNILFSWNHGLVSGSKDILLIRIIDGAINGRFERCPMCNGSRLKLNMENGGRTVICGGHFDEETNLPIPCSFTCAANEVPRMHPWYSREPTEEEKEAMTAENEASKTDNVGDEKGMALLSNLQEKANELDWDLSSTAGLKKGAKDILHICTGHIDLPDDEGKARMKVGQLVAANRTRSAAEILVLVADKFGFASVKAEKGKAKEQAMSSICKHHKNAPTMSVMLELRDLYGKESNRNAAGSYGRVANAIKDLDYEITGKQNSKLHELNNPLHSKIFVLAHILSMCSILIRG